jgi:hypothetical protein
MVEATKEISITRSIFIQVEKSLFNNYSNNLLQSAVEVQKPVVSSNLKNNNNNSSSCNDHNNTDSDNLLYLWTLTKSKNWYAVLTAVQLEPVLAHS